MMGAGAVTYPDIDVDSPEWQKIYNDWIEQQAATAYGWASAFLLHPEIGPLLRQAAKEGWTQQTLENAIRKTQWWQTTTEAQRNWDRVVAEDPASAQAQVTKMLDDVRAQAAELGGSLTDEQITTIATRALRDGWDMAQFKAAIAGEMLRDPAGATAIRTGIVGRSVSEIAYNYGVPMSQGTLDSWAQKIATGTITLDDFTNWARTQATAMFPGIADDIQRGLTVKELSEPYAQIAAQVIGVTAADLDFADPKWNQALNYVDASGTRRSMTLYEWADVLRHDPIYGYDSTPDAVSKAYTVASMLARTFGRI